MIIWHASGIGSGFPVARPSRRPTIATEPTRVGTRRPCCVHGFASRTRRVSIDGRTHLRSPFVIETDARDGTGVKVPDDWRPRRRAAATMARRARQTSTIHVSISIES